MSTIEGTWHSRYEYGRGANDEPQTSEHQIELPAKMTLGLVKACPMAKALK